MRKNLGIMAVLLTIGFVPCSLYAQDAPTPAPVQALSPQDAAAARAELANLAQAFGVKTDPAPAASPANQDTEHKTVSDVADKALDLVSRAVASISATLEKVAPHVWKIMIKQQYAKAIGGLIVPLGLLFLTTLYWRILRKLWKTDGMVKASEEWWTHLWFANIIPCFFGVIFAAWSFARLAESVMLLVNPEYYAVRDIITMLLGQAPQ